MTDNKQQNHNSRMLYTSDSRCRSSVGPDHAMFNLLSHGNNVSYQKVEIIESGERLSTKQAISILLSISFGVGYLFLPLSFFVLHSWISLFLLFFNFVSGIIAVYMLMDVRAQIPLGTYQEIAYYLSRNRGDIITISIIFLLFFGVNCAMYLQLLGNFTLQFITLTIKSIQHKDYTHDSSDEMYWWSIYAIIIAEALIVLPLCRVLNYQKFKVLAYPIMATIIMVFLCLIFELVFSLQKTLIKADFCLISEGVAHSFNLPSSEFGVAWANVVPSLCFTFGFQIYMLQVHQALDKPDVNGKRGMIIGSITMIVIFVSYFALLLISQFFYEKHVMDYHIIYVYDLIFNAGLTFEFITQILVIIQLFCHLPFIFYITKEQAYILIDEIQRSSMSRMIDEMRIQKDKAKKYTLSRHITENGVQDQDNSIKNNKYEPKQIAVYTQYRLPHMTMNNRSTKVTFWVTFLTIVLIALTQFQFFMNAVSLFGATCVPLSLYILPGYFFSKFHYGYDQRKYIAGVLFAAFGLVIIFVYSALVLYSNANIVQKQTN
eukprot:403349521